MLNLAPHDEDFKGKDKWKKYVFIALIILLMPIGLIYNCWNDRKYK